MGSSFSKNVQIKCWQVFVFSTSFKIIFELVPSSKSVFVVVERWNLLGHLEKELLRIVTYSRGQV